MLIQWIKEKLLARKEYIFWPALLGLLIFLSLNRHSKSGVNNYHSEIWADKAGYYIYLPATVIYGWQTTNLPPEIDQKTGDGFRITDHQTIVTKYTYGVSLFEFPFFVSNYFIQQITEGDLTGFGKSYAGSISIASCFWLTWGLYLFSLALRKFISTNRAIANSFLLLAGTNLLYYGIIDGGMSHVYSFFLFSLLLYLITEKKPEPTMLYRFLFGLAIGLILVVRPVNLLFVALLFTASVCLSHISMKEIVKLVFSPIVVVTIVLCILPQTIYWNYSYGHPLVFSYEGESFEHLTRPPLHKYLFAPHNGLFTYSPMWLLFFIPLIRRDIINLKIRISHLTGFIIITYIFASWWNWNYGCGFGCRTMSEYTAVFSLPFFIFYSEKIYGNRLLQVILAICILINLKLIFSYDQCWQGEDWDWQLYANLLFGPTK